MRATTVHIPAPLPMITRKMAMPLKSTMHHHHVWIVFWLMTGATLPTQGHLPGIIHKWRMNRQEIMLPEEQQDHIEVERVTGKTFVANIKEMVTTLQREADMPEL
mmetsp:Transcript_18737/g.45041  ORF Transcript_18737/g.45041 Transcript_18737/m.45041 type:complete len:105 (+) Transcript_18737:547-861(+)